VAKYTKKGNKIADLDANRLATAIEEYEGLNKRAAQPLVYGLLKLYTNVVDKDVHKLLKTVRKEDSNADGHLSFFRQAVKKIDPEKLEEMYSQSDVLEKYRPYIEGLQRDLPYILSDEQEEEIIRQRAESAAVKSVKAYQAHLGALRFEVANEFLDEKILNAAAKREAKTIKNLQKAVEKGEVDKQEVLKAAIERKKS